VERQLISSGSPYESVAGFSRAVRVGPHVFVAGTAPIMPGGGGLADPPWLVELEVEAVSP
jgi:hypothetical protein